MAYVGTKETIKHRKHLFVGPPRYRTWKRAQYRRANPEKERQWRRNWAKKNDHTRHAHSHIHTLRCRYPEVAENISHSDLANWIKENKFKPCCYCGCESIHIDHRIPLADGGKHSFDNIQMICATCNRAKNNMTEKEYIRWIERLAERRR